MSVEPIVESNIQPTKSYDGLGGWLVLVCLGLIVAPIRDIVALLTTYGPLMSIDIWEGFFTAGSDIYNPKLGIFVGAEMIINLLLILVDGIALVFFFQRRTIFPKLFIGYLVAKALFLIVDTIVVSHLFPSEEAFDPETRKAIGQSLFGIIIWVPYMLVSKRVRATFIH